MIMSRHRLLSILLDPSRRKKISIVHLPALFFILWIYVAAANAEPRRLELRDADLFTDDSLADDSNLFLDDKHDDVNSMIGPDHINTLFAGDDDQVSSSLLPDTVDWNQSITEADSDAMLTDLDSNSLLLETESQLFADADLACEVGTTDDIQLFGKRRRETLCPVPITPPMGQANTPGSEQPTKKSSQPQLTPWQLYSSDEAVKAGLDENPDLCPEETYLKSNTPVCKKAYGVSASDFYTIPGQYWVHLFNVDPSKPMVQNPPCS